MTKCTHYDGDRLLCDGVSNGLHMDMVVTYITCDLNDRGLHKNLSNMKAQIQSLGDNSDLNK